MDRGKEAKRVEYVIGQIIPFMYSREIKMTLLRVHDQQQLSKGLFKCSFNLPWY